MTSDALIEVGSASRASELESKRRWFHSRQMDLYVWLDDSDKPYGFELTYQKVTTEFSFRWDSERGFGHSQVGSSSGAGGHTASQLLSVASQPDVPYVKDTFTGAAASLPANIRTLVQDALTLYPQSPKAPGSRPTPAQVRARRPFNISGDGLVWIVGVIVVLWALHALV